MYQFIYNLRVKSIKMLIFFRESIDIIINSHIFYSSDDNKYIGSF